MSRREPLVIARVSSSCQAARESALTDIVALLRIHAVNDHVVTLGPAPAVAIWVQGCGRGCAGCASEQTWAPEAGALADTADIVAWLSASPHRHLSISGGEPLEQAPALVSLIEGARRERDWVVTCYTGYRIETLRRDIRPGRSELVKRLDLLIDGPYIQELHAPLLWRGSSNQRIHNLSGRVALPADDESVGVSPVVGSDGSFELVGVYPEPRMLEDLVKSLGRRGTPVSVSPRRRTFPFPTRKEP